MADEPVQPESAREPQIDQGAYRVIRQRLDRYDVELRDRLDRLNADRREVFGGTELKLVGSDRITTPHNCVPRDMLAIGQRFLFGFNVRFGLKKQIKPADVLAVYRFADGRFHEEPLDLIADGTFDKDFADLYRYYKDTRFARFFARPPHVYMKFHVGQDVDDFKAFKWAVEPGEQPDRPRLHYLDPRSDHEVRYPRQSPFDWQRATREMQRPGLHPHVSIEDLVFVECTGGDLTIKVEDNTQTGKGIYTEPVDNPDQTLDDAEVHYVVQGPIVLLRIKPFQERAARHFIFNTKTREVVRQDAIASACQLLPEDHGIVFPTGYYLASGVTQTFPSTLPDSHYERTVVSPNGEDYLIVFYQRQTAQYTLMPYNLIGRRVDTPIVCHGYTVFDDGSLVLFKTQDEPQKHHAVQVWQSPFHGPDFARQTPHVDSQLYKIGNRAVVRAMAECAELSQLIGREDLYQELYLDLVETASGLLDSYHWLGDDACHNLGATIEQIRQAGQAAIGEYDKLLRDRRTTAEAIDAAERRVAEIVSENGARVYDRIEPFVEALTALRRVRGEVISLRELKHADAERIEELETRVAEQAAEISERTVAFLVDERSLEPYRERADAFDAKIAELATVLDARALSEDVADAAAALELLIEVVGNLEMDDATLRTAIIDRISAIFATINAARSTLRARTSELGQAEGAAEFASQIKLVEQSVTNYLDLCDTPESTADYQTRVMVQLEELEGKFSEFDAFVVQLVEKRNEVVQAFEARRVGLVEQRNRRAQSMAEAADRVLAGVKSRVDRMESVNEINSYLAGDLMVDKARDLIDRLRELGDPVKADDVQSRLNTIREEAVRQLKDRQDLQADGVNTIRFGRHVFSVNTQPVELTTAVRDGDLQLHLTGTRFYETVDDPELIEARAYWDRPLVSESDTVYRGEYLAYRLLREVESLPADEREAVMHESEDERLARVQAYMAPRYREGYVKGVHDRDATLILTQLLDLSAKVGLLRYPTRPRALASAYWQASSGRDDRRELEHQLQGFGRVVAAFPHAGKQPVYIAELARRIEAFAEGLACFDGVSVELAARYLFAELVRPVNPASPHQFVVSPEATDLSHALLTHLRATKSMKAYQESVDALADPGPRYVLVRDWVEAYAKSASDEGVLGFVDETAAVLLEGPHRPHASRLIDVSVHREIDGMVGDHPVIEQGRLTIDYHAMIGKLDRFVTHDVPAFERFQAAKKRVVEAAASRMRVGEFEPRVLSSFVRNRLVDQVFLPLIGDNLAKQMGTADANTRTDRMGLLLLISPPGYGKTTLMEYVAARLGVVFIKVNGPALGHAVTSLDPQEAPNAAAREEVNKLNLAFEIGDNVVIYVDDIQHTNPEFLQRFISLCDGTRRIEGVYRGQTRTYDLRGRKVAVVMAGNPYTESGEKFRLPDMLTNRADTYNLGDIVGGHAEAFKLSYLENCLTSNPLLRELAAAPSSDVHAVIRMAETGEREGIDLETAFSGGQVDEMVAVMKHLVRVRDVILRVNQEYISSAGMEDEYRTEPPFLLQGSYRNMNRIAERVVAVMNDDELTTLIQTTYEQDAQTLTSGAESNLLKFKSLFGWLTEEEARRWEQITAAFRRANDVRSMGGDDRTAAVLAQLSMLGERLTGIDGTLRDGIGRLEDDGDAEVTLGPMVTERVGELSSHLVEIRATIEAGLGEMARQQAAAAEVAASERDGEATAPVAGTGENPLTQAMSGEVRVVHELPRPFLFVLRKQFELMQRWLQPISEAASQKNAQVERINQTITELSDQYRQIIGALERDEAD